MRIRKNAKRSPLRWPASSPMAGQIIQTHYCQLNQSPWDVMSFSSLPESSVSTRPPSPPPPSSWIDKKDMIRAGKECLVENVPVVESPIMLCSKANEKGWPCRRKASNESSLCEYHQSMVKNCAMSSNQSKKLVEDRDRSRRKKTPANSSSSAVPDEFYYYSGFGPRWRKRRGENVNRGETSASRNAEHVRGLSPAMLSQFDDEDTESDHDVAELVEAQKKEVEKGRKRGRPSKKGR